MKVNYNTKREQKTNTLLCLYEETNGRKTAFIGTRST